MDVALPAVIFLCSAIPFYWLLIVLTEMKVLSFRRRGNLGRSDIVDQHANNMESLIKR